MCDFLNGLNGLPQQEQHMPMPAFTPMQHVDPRLANATALMQLAQQVKGTSMAGAGGGTPRRGGPAMGNLQQANLINQRFFNQQKLHQMGITNVDQLRAATAAGRIPLHEAQQMLIENFGAMQ